MASNKKIVGRKQITVCFTDRDVKKWNTISNYYYSHKNAISSSEVMRIIVEKEYQSLVKEKKIIID